MEMAWEACEVNFRMDVLMIDHQRYLLEPEQQYPVDEPEDGEYKDVRHVLAASNWWECHQKVFGLFPHWNASAIPNCAAGHEGFALGDMCEHATAWLSLWELMETWVHERVPPEPVTTAAVEVLVAELDSADSTADFDGRESLRRAVAVAGECIAVEFGRNCVVEYQQAPVVPHVML